MSTTIRISGERKEQLAKYATAAVYLYGVISVDEFVNVFNHYEPDEKTDLEEAALALQRHRKANPEIAEYSIKGDIISGPDFQPCFDTYKEDVELLRQMQKNKPRYLPEKEEFFFFLVRDNSRF